MTLAPQNSNHCVCLSPDLVSGGWLSPRRGICWELPFVNEDTLKSLKSQTSSCFAYVCWRIAGPLAQTKAPGVGLIDQHQSRYSIARLRWNICDNDRWTRRSTTESRRQCRSMQWHCFSRRTAEQLRAAEVHFLFLLDFGSHEVLARVLSFRPNHFLDSKQPHLDVAITAGCTIKVLVKDNASWSHSSNLHGRCFAHFVTFFLFEFLWSFF